MTERRNLIAIAAGLGLTASLLGGGIFAVFTDRATTGPNDATTRSEARAADLKLAPATVVGGIPECAWDEFVDDLATGIISVTDLSPGSTTNLTGVCLRNDGSAAVNVELWVIDLVDLDVACTGDEAAAGDATCGGNQLGEASSALVGEVQRYDCQGIPKERNSLAINADLGFPLLNEPLQPGHTTCLTFSVGHFPGSDTSLQIMQSDMVTWRWAFDGTTS